MEENIQNIAVQDCEEVIRYDNSSLDNIRLNKTDEGYLEGYAIATRTGVFQYVRADGTIQRELRLPEEVFKEDAINSFKLLPITNNHPQDEVNAENVTQLAVGYTGEDVRRKDNYLMTKLKITDKKTIDQIKSGKKGLSYGYKVSLVKKDGVYNGEQYDYVQTNIKGNHLAIVYQGRAGDQARLRIDSQDALCVFSNINNNQNMKTIRLDQKEFDVAEEVALKLDSLEAEISSLKEVKKELSTKVDSLQGERDALKEQVFQLSKKDNADEIKQLVAQRLDLEKKAQTILNQDENVSLLSDKEIKTKVIMAFSPEFKADEKSDEYITARFDAIIDMKKDLNLAKNIGLTANSQSLNLIQNDLSSESLQRKLVNKTNSLIKR